MASGCKINSNTFDAFCLDIAHLLMNLYPWFYMPAIVHKILSPGSAVIQKYMVPIGLLSEEVQEARNKGWKRYTLLILKQKPTQYVSRLSDIE